MKLPAFQFYPGDWRKDTGVQSLDYETRGVWIEILCLMHESERRGVLTLNGNAMPDSALARLLGLEEILLKQILSKLEDHGVASRERDSGALLSRRMVRDESLRRIRQEAGKQGGNPALLKQKETTPVIQISTPSVSSSASADKKKEGKARPESQKACEEFCESIELPKTDGEWFWNKCEGVGWKNSGQPIKDWKSTIRAWKTAFYMPSQKGGKTHGNNSSTGGRSHIALSHDSTGEAADQYKGR